MAWGTPASSPPVTEDSPTFSSGVVDEDDEGSVAGGIPDYWNDLAYLDTLEETLARMALPEGILGPQDMMDTWCG